MASRIFCFVIGVIYLALGIMGFIPSLMYRVTPGPYPGGIITTVDYLGAIFPVNFAVDVVNVLIGLAAIGSSLTWPTATSFCRGMTFLFAIMGLCGMVQGLDRLFGLFPMSAWNIPLHFVSFLLCWYFGFVYPLEFKPHTDPRTLSSQAAH